MATDKDSERQKSYSIIRRNSERILQLINQLMDIRKIDKGQMLLEFQETDLVTLLQDIYTIFDFQAKVRNIDFRFHYSTESLNAWIDPKNFDKIIINVLSNALKFAPANGQVALFLNTVRDETGEFAEIVITDSGIGVSESEIERIFDRFYQIRNSQNNSNMGTGIGLHLTRSLVELHHGSIRVENNPDGKGCSFIIRLPLGKEHLSPEEVKERSVLPARVVSPAVYRENPLPEEEKKIRSRSKWRVLIVEDDDEIRNYMSGELSEEYHITESVNGKEALALILENAPDLVISDIMMPEMDGITLCRKIKQNVNINHIPVILLTAKSGEEDNLEGLSIGADAYLTKPFSLEIVKKTIENIIKNREILRNTFNGNQQQAENIQEIKMKTPNERLQERVMFLINENIANPDLSVEMIAAGVGISRVHLHRKLKELTNQSTRDLIRNIRLKQAATLLSSGKPVDTAEVAYATGFTHMSYFSFVFKEMYGMSPKAYLEKHLQDKS